MVNLNGIVDCQEKLDALLGQAVDMGASDIHLSTGKPIKIRIDGKMRPVTTRALTVPELESILAETFKSKTILTQIFASKAFNYAYETECLDEASNVRFRVNASTRMHKNARVIKVTMRVLNQDIPKPKQVGVDEGLVTRLTALGAGAVLISGVTGSGKSTLIASIMQERIKRGAEHMLTLEHPVEYVFSDADSMGEVTQQSVAEYGGNYTSFSQGLVEAMRQDPDAILVGEVRDALTAKAALQAVETGHALFATVHASGVVDIVSRMNNILQDDSGRDYFPDIVSSLNTLIYQALIPARAGGRCAIREVLYIDQHLKEELLRNKGHYKQILADALKMQRGRLIDDLEQKLTSGVIDIGIFKQMIQKFNLSVEGQLHEAS